MKKFLPQTGLLFLLLLPLLVRAQEWQISGRVVDSVTKLPILFASLNLREEGNGGITDEKGYFRLIVLNKSEQDSLVFMKLGYGRRAVFIENGKAANLVIELNPRQVILTNNCLSRPYIADSESLRIANDEVIRGFPGTKFAFFVGNDKRKQTRKMRSVSFYVGENGLPMVPFRIHIYQAGNHHTPATDLLTERVVLAPSRSGQWFISDLSRYNVAVPKEGYFVALEFEKSANQLPQPTLDNYLPSGQIMRPPFDFKKSSLWHFSSEKGWSLVPQSSSSRRYSAMVKLEVEAVD